MSLSAKTPGLLDANYRRVPGRDRLGRQPSLYAVVQASRCSSLLLYILLYGLDTYASRQLGQTPASHARSADVGLFVPKPTRDPAYHHSYSVWPASQRPWASAAVRCCRWRSLLI